MPELDSHGKVVVNFLLSLYVYAMVAGVLTMCMVGVPLLIFLWCIGFVLPIIGAVKASSGELWPYPGSIPFFK
jgi:uncharacterized Tic20 family protein